MTSLTLATILQLPLLVCADDEYAAAHQKTVETGRPMVVMVGAEWCPACKQMESSVLPRVREHGLLRRVAFALVNYDKDPELSRDLTGGGPIPQLILFRHTNNGWKKAKLVGGQSVETVEEFIKTQVAEDDTAKSADGAKKSEPPPATEKKNEPKKAKVQPVSTQTK